MSETTVQILVEMGFRPAEPRNPSLRYRVVHDETVIRMHPSDMHWTMRSPLVIGYPDLKIENIKDYDKILSETFQREIDDREEQIANIKLCHVVAAIMAAIPQPVRDIEKEYRWSPGESRTERHTYYNVFFGWGSELRIHVRFTDFDTDEEKDSIVEMVLSLFHKHFGCTWSRTMSKDNSKFKTKVRVGNKAVDVVMQMDDSLGCWIEEVVKEREASKWEREDVIIKDGMVLKPCKDMRVDANGEIVKIERSFKSYCDGEAR